MELERGVGGLRHRVGYGLGVIGKECMTLSYMLKWSEKEADDFCSRLTLKIYFEFCYKQRNQEIWEAGWDTITRIAQEGPMPPG